MDQGIFGSFQLVLQDAGLIALKKTHAPITLHSRILGFDRRIDVDVKHVTSPGRISRPSIQKLWELSGS